MPDTTKDQPAQPHETDNMGYHIAPETTLPETSTAPDTQTIINDAVKQVTVGDNGKYVYPDDMDPMLKAAVAATKSYRDNQSGFTKSQQNLKESEAVNEALREQLANHKQPLELTQEETTELSDLMKSDPNAWRLKLNELELNQDNKVDTLTDEARHKASGEFELEQRYAYLQEFNNGRAGLTNANGKVLISITPDILDSDIPPRMTKKLSDGDITFQAYLDEVAEYLDAGKAVSTTPDTTTTDLNKANGSTVAGETDKQKQGELDYSQQAF